MGDAYTILQIPVKEFTLLLDDLNVTEMEDRFYWHVHISDVKGRFMLRLKAGKQPVDITKYVIKVGR